MLYVGLDIFDKMAFDCFLLIFFLLVIKKNATTLARSWWCQSGRGGSQEHMHRITQAHTDIKGPGDISTNHKWPITEH